MSVPLAPSDVAPRAGRDWLSRLDPELENALRFHFEGAAAPGAFAKTSDGFALRLDVAGDLPALEVGLRSDDGWMFCSARLPGSAAKITPTRLLEASTGLYGGVKVSYAVDATGPPRPELRAEVPLNAGADLVAVLGAVLNGFAQGALRIAERSEQPTTSPLPGFGTAAAVAHPHHDTAGGARALADAGWTTSVREDGRLFVDLDVSDGYRQGLLETGPNGHLRLCSALPEPAPSPCADALAIAALLTSGWVRMVRAIYDGAFRLEVALGPGLGDAAVPCAAAALSVALRVLGDEAEILARDCAVASHYARNCTAARGSRVGKQGKGRPPLDALADTATAV